MVFHWSLSDSKSPQVSRTRLRILAVLSNAVVWIVSNPPPTSKSSRPFNNPLVIVPNAPITISTIVIFMFHSFFNSLARSRCLSFFSLSFRFILWFAGTAKSTILQILFFFLFFFFFFFGWLLWGLVFWPGLLLLLLIITPVLADGFPLESEWHQVSQSLRSQQYYSLDGLLSSSYFQILQFLYQSFGDCTKSTNYNWYFNYYLIPWEFFI